MDDINKYVFARKFDDTSELYQSVAKQAISSTGETTKTFRRYLKPVKYFWYIVDYECSWCKWRLKDIEGQEIEIEGYNRKCNSFKSLVIF